MNLKAILKAVGVPIFWKKPHFSAYKRQKTSKKRIVQYLAYWLGWVMLGQIGIVQAEECDASASKVYAVTANEGIIAHSCGCHDVDGNTLTEMSTGFLPYIIDPESGSLTLKGEAMVIITEANYKSTFLKTADELDNYQSLYETIPDNITFPETDYEYAKLSPNSEFIFKNTSSDNEYFKCLTDSDGMFVYPITIGLEKCSDGTIQEECPVEEEEQVDSQTGQPPSLPDYYTLFVAGSQAHIKSSPSGIDCEYGQGTCSKVFDRGEIVELELIDIKTAEGFNQGDYSVEWFGDADCHDQKVTMNDTKNCAVQVYGKSGIDYSNNNSNQLQFLNFSGHSTLRGEAEDVFLGFILEGEEGTVDVILHADILEEGVLPQLDFNEVIIDEQGIRGSLLKRHQHSDNFILEHNVGAGIYTIQMSSVGAKGRGMAGITLKNNQLDLTNLSVRGHLKDFLVLNFIVGGEGKQKIQVNTRILSGDVVTELHLLDLSQQGVANEALTEGAIIEVGAGAYAILLKVVSGEGIGMIEADLLQ